MIPVTALRTGTYFTDGKDLLEVLAYEHIKLGRGTANIKIKVRNLITGAVSEKGFISGARVEEVVLDKKEAQYLYRDQREGDFHFMDLETFDQFVISGNLLKEKAKFLKEGMNVKILFWQGKPLSVDLPIKMVFQVVEAAPGVKGNSATNIWKEALLENGLKAKVPLFINEGNKIVVDTRTGEYIERAKQ